MDQPANDQTTPAADGLVTPIPTTEPVAPAPVDPAAPPVVEPVDAPVAPIDTAPTEIPAVPDLSLGSVSAPAEQVVPEVSETPLVPDAVAPEVSDTSEALPAPIETVDPAATNGTDQAQSGGSF